MSFRKDSVGTLHWAKWLDRNHSELVASGLPDFLYADEFRWLRFLEHGIDAETEWQPAMLPANQLYRLRVFLAREYDERILDVNLRLPIHRHG